MALNSTSKGVKPHSKNHSRQFRRRRADLNISITLIIVMRHLPRVTERPSAEPCPFRRIDKLPDQQLVFMHEICSSPVPNTLHFFSSFSNRTSSPSHPCLIRWAVRHCGARDSPSGYLFEKKRVSRMDVTRWPLELTSRIVDNSS